MALSQLINGPMKSVLIRTRISIKVGCFCLIFFLQFLYVYSQALVDYFKGNPHAMVLDCTLEAETRFFI
jgi:hypothetical protein